MRVFHINAGLLPTPDVHRIEHLWLFGQLIANTDMHTGNLSFQPHNTLTLAPVYDMLPMRYAPLPGGETPTPTFSPSLPLQPQRAAWATAHAAALQFWQLAARDSPGFRNTCAANAEQLQQIVGSM